MLEFDHIAVCCTDLEAGVVAIETALGVPLAGGGRHDSMGTHNRLLSLGGRDYLEVIAIDPAAPPPGRPRWFALDHFTGPPRPVAWVMRCDDLDHELARLGPGPGVATEVARGPYRWRMAVPPNGRLPFEGVHPALIEWQGAHPALSLPESGCRLARLTVRHPLALDLSERIGPRDQRLRFISGPPGIVAEIVTPRGTVTLK